MSNTFKCPHCNTLDCISEVALNNAETYGSNTFDLLCTSCGGMIEVALSLRVVCTSIIKSEAESDSFGNKPRSIHLLSWFTCTAFCKLKHPKYGWDQVSPKQIRASSKKYQRELYKELLLSIDEGNVHDDQIEFHSKKENCLRS